MYLDSVSRPSTHASARPNSTAIDRYGRTVLEHAWVVVLCVVIAVAAAMAYVVKAPRKYQAEAQMLVSPVPLSDSALVALPVLHASTDPTRDALTAASLMTNLQVASGVVSGLHLRETPRQLLANVTATPVGQSNLVAVQATASSAGRAQQIANEFVQQVVTTRAADLHAAIAQVIPGLKAQVARLPATERSGAGTVGDDLAQLQQLQGTNDPTITVATLASRPSAPSYPRTKLTLIAALLGGLILGLGAAFGLDAIDPRIRREDQLREIFDVPVLARIPRQRRSRFHARRRKLHRPLRPEELSFGAAEGYRTLRTILRARAAGDARSFLVTGCAPGDGKTTSAMGLAAALAQGGSGVILVDADFRRPSIAEVLGLDVQFGIDDLLTGAADLDDALAVTKFRSTSVGVLALRHPDPDLADLLSLNTAADLMKQLKALSDFVVIDSPPLTAVSDALPLAQIVDDVVIVVRLGSTKLSQLWELHDLLVEQKSYPAGIVLIGQPAPRAGGYYGRDAGPAHMPRHQTEGQVAERREALGQGTGHPGTR